MQTYRHVHDQKLINQPPNQPTNQPSINQSIPSPHLHSYAASYSTDHGVSWTLPKPIEGTGCARPRLQRLGGGALLMTGGRLCVENMTGIFLWLNADGMGGFGSDKPGTEVWQRHSITAQHNRLWGGESKYLFSDMVNDSSVFETLSYTSILPTGPRAAVITYNKFECVYPGGAWRACSRTLCAAPSFPN